MRLTDRQASRILQLAQEVAGIPVDVRVFGSRLDDRAKGGDLDLLIELAEPVAEPALLATRLSAKVSRLFDGRKVDVLLSEPKRMRRPIHEIARREGQKL